MQCGWLMMLDTINHLQYHMQAFFRIYVKFLFFKDRYTHTHILIYAKKPLINNNFFWIIYMCFEWLYFLFILSLSLDISPRNKNFFHLLVDLQRILALKLCPERYQGWEISVHRDNLEIYVDKAMYNFSHAHYFIQFCMVNLQCRYYPTSAPKIIINCFFNNWIQNIVINT